jgi:hypothetical protein
MPRSKVLTRRLPRGALVPSAEPSRYKTRDGYTLYRWLIGPGQYVEALEHRIVDGRVVDAETVHHHDHNRQHNHPENLSELDRAAHQRIHHPQAIDRAEAARLYTMGLSTIQVAAELGTHPGNVSRMLREQGVQARPQPPKRKDIDPTTVEALGRAGMPWDAIARQVGCSRGPVERILRRAGIPPRKAGNPQHHDRTHADPLNATACGLMASAPAVPAQPPELT